MLEKDTFGQSASRCDARSICQPYPNAWKVSLSNWNASIRATRRANGSDRSNETAGKSLDTVELGDSKAAESGSRCAEDL